MKKIAKPPKRIVNGLAAVLIAVMATGCALVEDLSGPQPRLSATAATDPEIVARHHPVVPSGYLVRIGDKLGIFVVDNQELTRIVPVGPDGSFRFPLAGQIHASGRSLQSIESVLTARLSNTIIDPQVSVSLSDLQPYSIFVDGEVTRPGEFTMDEPTTLVQAIALAGGFTAFADRNQVILYNPMRAQGRRLVFDYDAFLVNSNARDIFLRSGDTVIVR